MDDSHAAKFVILSVAKDPLLYFDLTSATKQLVHCAQDDSQGRGGCSGATGRAVVPVRPVRFDHVQPHPRSAKVAGYLEFY